MDLRGAQDCEQKSLSPQESVQRDQSMCANFCREGPRTQNRKCSQLSSRFASFNPAGDFHAYALSSLPREGSSEAVKATQQASLASQTAPAAAALPVLLSRKWGLAPSNPSESTA
jgi:hypothetical protein